MEEEILIKTKEILRLMVRSKEVLHIKIVFQIQTSFRAEQN